MLKKAASGEEGIYLIPIKPLSPTPQGFLEIFYSKNKPTDTLESFYIKSGVYVNSRFDKYYEKGLRSGNKEDRLKNFMKAEQILIKDASVIPLWYEEEYMLFYSYVKNYIPDVEPYGSFAEVYFSK